MYCDNCVQLLDQLNPTFLITWKRHQALVANPADPTTEFFVGFSDFRFPNLPENHLPGSDDTSDYPYHKESAAKDF